MKRREYNEIYGFLPDYIVDRFTEFDKRRLFIEWLMRKPTATGWFITRSVVTALGDGFVDYILKGIMSDLVEEGTPVTKETLVEELSTMMEHFASDSNSLEEYVRLYRTEVLGLDDYDFSEEAEEKEKESNRPKQQRDSNGRFVKSK